MDPFLTFLRKTPNFTQVFNTSPSLFTSILDFFLEAEFANPHVKREKTAGIPLGLRIRVPLRQPHVTEKCEADLSPFPSSPVSVSAMGLRV